MLGPVASVVTRGVPADFVPTAAFHGKNRTIERNMQLEAFTIFEHLYIHTFTTTHRHNDITEPSQPGSRLHYDSLSVQ